MENKVTLGQEYKNILMLFTVLCTGIILFAGVSVVINSFNGPFIHNEKFAQILLGSVIILAVICLYLAHSIYNKQLRSEIQTPISLQEKLSLYRPILIKYMSFLEAPALLSIAGFLLTGYFRFLAITLILLLNMLLKRPTKNRISTDLQLSSIEQTELS